MIGDGAEPLPFPARHRLPIGAGYRRHPGDPRTPGRGRADRRILGYRQVDHRHRRPRAACRTRLPVLRHRPRGRLRRPRGRGGVRRRRAGSGRARGARPARRARHPARRQHARARGRRSPGLFRRVAAAARGDARAQRPAALDPDRRGPPPLARRVGAGGDRASEEPSGHGLCHGASRPAVARTRLRASACCSPSAIVLPR